MSTKQSDLGILVRQMAVSNTEKAYKEIFKILFKPLMRFSYSILKSWEMAEEVAGDVLFMIWKQREKLTEVKNIKYYAFVAARNTSLNLLKKQTGKETVSFEEIDWDVQLDNTSPEVIFMQGELKAKLERAIATLPNQCRLVFKLIKEDGFSYKEVAEMLHISTKTVDAHLVNAIKKLTVILKAEFKLA